MADTSRQPGEGTPEGDPGTQGRKARLQKRSELIQRTFPEPLTQDPFGGPNTPIPETGRLQLLARLESLPTQTLQKIWESTINVLSQIPDVDQAMIKKAKGGSIQAAKLVYERAGILGASRGNLKDVEDLTPDLPVWALRRALAEKEATLKPVNGEG